jgi:hypothetical protein
MLPLSGDCQEVLIDRDILIRVASQLDSFEVLKDIEKRYIAFKDSCLVLTKTQDDYILTQENIIYNKDNQISLLKQSEVEYKGLLKVNENLIKDQRKKTKIAKRNTVISLFGGGILTVGLTTALLITIIQ